MKRNTWVICGAWLLAAACSNGGIGVPDMNSHPLPDGHLSGCSSDNDCNDGNKCHTYHCNIATQTCANQDVACSASDACHVGACDPTNGCSQMPGNDNATCTDPTTGAIGKCANGACVPPPTCDNSMNSLLSLACGIGNTDDNINDVSASFGSATNVISTYACATNETGAEMAYPFTFDVGGLVTVTLTITGVSGADGGTDGGTDAGAPSDLGAPGDLGTPPPADADLDLIILDGACTSTAACMNPKLPGGAGYQGITAGTGRESVTFTAAANHPYFIVVDGHNGAVANYHIEVVACGKCQPTPTTTLGCNMSTPLSGDTSKGMNALSTYMCTNNGTASTVTSLGNEQAFLFTSVAPVTQPIRATVSGASGPVNLMALPEDFDGQCDPTSCMASNAITSGSGSIQFSATSGATPYWVVVDTPTAGAQATFGLQLDCLPFCTNDSFADTIDCTTRAVSSTNDPTLSDATNDITAWGPNPVSAPCGGLTNLTGPERVYLFTTPAVADATPQYTFTLGSTDAAHLPLSLLILKAGSMSTTMATCDPALACANTTGTYTTSGTTPATVTLSLDAAGVSYYYVVIDAPNGNIGGFALNVSGTTTTTTPALCP
jgi:hypothetical protein